MLRWQRFGTAVYPIAEALAKQRQQQPLLSVLLAVLVSLLILLLSGRIFALAMPLEPGFFSAAVIATVVLSLLFAGQPLRADGAEAPPAQAELLSRSLRRYFVPLPLIALGGPWALVVLWWLRYAPVPGRQWVNHWLNLWTARLVSVHFSLARESRQSLQWAMLPVGQSPPSLYAWCLQWLLRTQDEMTFPQLWQTLVSIRWQWLLLAVLISLWLR